MKKLNILLFLTIFINENLKAEENGTIETLFKVSPLVSLIVSTEDPKHALEALSNAARLSKNVKVRNVLLVSKGKEALSLVSENVVATNPDALKELPQNFLTQVKHPPYLKEYSAAMDELGLVSSEVSFNDSVISRLRLSYSPTWIVRHEGKDYVFEGYSDISRYFTRNGEFKY